MADGKENNWRDLGSEKVKPVQRLLWHIFFCFCFLFATYQLLGGNRISISELKEFAARQQQEIAAKEKELKAKQVQFMEMRRKLQNKPQNPSVQQLSAKADEQEQRLRELRHAQDQTDSYKLSNGALGTFGILTFLLSASLFSLQTDTLILACWLWVLYRYQTLLSITRFCLRPKWANRNKSRVENPSYPRSHRVKGFSRFFYASSCVRLNVWENENI